MHSQKKNLIIFLLFFLFVFGHTSTNYGASWHFGDYPNIVDNLLIHIKDFRFNTLKRLFTVYPIMDNTYADGCKSGSDVYVRFKLLCGKR